MTGSDSIPSARDYWLLGATSALISVCAVIFYFRHGAILLYGDAVAHTNIARRVFDSRTPGILEFGTVWLPLPHLMSMPFVANGWLWHSGIGASIPSMLAYVAGVLGIFRLVRGWASRPAAWIAAFAYASNPNLIYMQTTAMVESLYLALFIWAAVHFSEFAQQALIHPQAARKSLELAAVLVCAAMLVRYDGWFLAFCAAIALLVILWRLHSRGLLDATLLYGAARCILLMALTAGLWLAYNHAAYGRSLEFATGPYSAHAIAERNRTASFPAYPGEKSLRTAALYFLKAAKLNTAEGRLEDWLLGVAFAALLAVIYFSRRRLPLVLLWTPAIFYILTIAYGSVPIFFPDWWPFSYYNVRYGLQMLPAIAVFIALACEFLSRMIPSRIVSICIIPLIVASVLSIWCSPISLREAEANGAARMAFDSRLGAELQKLPASATIMMYCGAHSGALQSAGIPFRRVLREGNHPAWDIALSEPAQAADYVVAITGDEVFLAVRLFPQHLRLVATVEMPKSPTAFIYRSTRE